VTARACLVLGILLSQGRTPAPPPVIDALEMQVRLDRAGFSPGEIDGRLGPNTRRALAAYARARRLAADLSAIVRALASEQPHPAVATYRIAAADVAGPFTPDIPPDLMQQAALPALGFRHPLEALGEKLHASPALLKRLNPGAAFAPGDDITAPNVRSGVPGPPDGPVTVKVSKTESALHVLDEDGSVIFHAPVTTGSEHDPLPVGSWKVTAVLWSPQFHYNPELFWDADPSHARATIPPGPNNPVGVVWIDLDKEHYGLHGTPEPSAIARRTSHGCVRLTNWDAARVASMVRPGTPVLFEP